MIHNFFQSKQQKIHIFFQSKHPKNAHIAPIKIPLFRAFFESLQPDFRQKHVPNDRIRPCRNDEKSHSHPMTMTITIGMGPLFAPILHSFCKMHNKHDDIQLFTFNPNRSLGRHFNLFHFFRSVYGISAFLPASCPHPCLAVARYDFASDATNMLGTNTNLP